MVNLFYPYTCRIQLLYCFSDHSRNVESEEVFQEQLTIYLSREFSNLLGQLIVLDRIFVVIQGRVMLSPLAHLLAYSSHLSHLTALLLLSCCVICVSVSFEFTLEKF